MGIQFLIVLNNRYQLFFFGTEWRKKIVVLLAQQRFTLDMLVSKDVHVYSIHYTYIHFQTFLSYFLPRFLDFLSCFAVVVEDFAAETFGYQTFANISGCCCCCFEIPY